MSDIWLAHHGILGQKWGVRRYQNKDGSLTASGKKRYLKEMHKDMEQHFKGQLSKEAKKVTSLNKNGYDTRGSAWNEAYKNGKVSAADDIKIKAAAKETRKWAVEKYGESAVKALAKSSVLGRKIDDFEVKQHIDLGKKAFKFDINKLSSILSPSVMKDGYSKTNYPAGTITDGYQKKKKPSGAIS